jgi:hypothetical protein
MFTMRSHWWMNCRARSELVGTPRCPAARETAQRAVPTNSELAVAKKWEPVPLAGAYLTTTRNADLAPRDAIPLWRRAKGKEFRAVDSGAAFSIEASVILPSRQGSEAHSTGADLFTLDDLRVCILMSATLVSLDAN